MECVNSWDRPLYIRTYHAGGKSRSGSFGDVGDVSSQSRSDIVPRGVIGPDVIADGAHQAPHRPTVPDMQWQRLDPTAITICLLLQIYYYGQDSPPSGFNQARTTWDPRSYHQTLIVQSSSNLNIDYHDCLCQTGESVWLGL